MHPSMIAGLSEELEKISSAHVDLIPGGLADKKQPKDFPAAALAKGKKTESEHTSLKPVATEIAMDHLMEDPYYYSKLEKMEKGAEELTTAAREKIPQKEFALPNGRYPIHNRSHARNALARVSQFGSASEKATVRAKVHAKYPDIGND